MKKLFITVPAIMLLAAACGQNPSTQQNTQTTPPPPVQQQANTAPSASGQIAGWQTYTSAKLSITFNYPQAWGKPVEDFHDSSTNHCQPQDDVCNAQKGKYINIHFSNDTLNHNNYPVIAAASPDFGTWEGGTYYGQVSLEDYYSQHAKFGNYEFATSATNTKIGNYPALSYITATVDCMDTFWGIQTIAKIDSKGFSGMTVLRNLDPTDYSKPNAKIPTDDQLKNFIKQVNNKTLDTASQSKIDQYNAFLSTIQFTQ